MCLQGFGAIGSVRAVFSPCELCHLEVSDAPSCSGDIVTHAQGFRDLLSELRRRGIRFIVTSRCQLGGGIHGAKHFHIRSLSPGCAADLLRSEAGEDLVMPEQADTLAHICGNNALALTIIGGFVACHAVTAEVRNSHWTIVGGIDIVNVSKSC